MEKGVVHELPEQGVVEMATATEVNWAEMGEQWPVVKMMAVIPPVEGEGEGVWGSGTEVKGMAVVVLHVHCEN